MMRASEFILRIEIFGVIFYPNLKGLMKLDAMKCLL